MKQVQPNNPLTDPLKRAIAESGLPLLTLEQKTGVQRATIMRFIRGDSSIRLDKADALARFFGLELQTRSEKETTSRSKTLLNKSIKFHTDPKRGTVDDR